MAKKFRQSLDPQALKKTLLDGQSVEVLQALGLVTAKGGASADANRKIKQIAHFLNLLAPALEDVFERHEEPVLVDGAAGKSYLGIVLYELWIKAKGRGRLITVESRQDLVERVARISSELGFERVEAMHATVLESELPEHVHFMLGLHACDTATDQILVRALEAKADHIAVVPCCQAELARQLKGAAAKGKVMSPLWKHAWHRREFGAQLTNVVRAQALQSRGYQVTVTELAGWEHSLKNELILAKRVQRYDKRADAELRSMLSEVPVTPWLLTTLDERLGPAVPA